MPTYRVMNSDGIVIDPEHKPDISHDEILKWYKTMLQTSIMDVIMFGAQRQGRISFYMVSDGEEGIAVGSASALTADDVVFSQYREPGLFAYRGFTLKDFMSQLFANKYDPGKGRCPPVHYGSAALNIHTISSTLATQLPHAAGAAYAVKIQDLQTSSRPKRVVACYFGEGAASEGDFHAALNMASTKHCPVIYICRNNGFAISTPSLEQYTGDGIASRGVGYGIDTIRVDGNDIFAVRAATAKARQMALADGGKPVLIEAMTYRVSHHSTSDDSFAYRAKVEVEQWKRRDNPIARLRKWMEAEGIWNDQMDQEERSRIRKEVLKEFSSAEKVKRAPLVSMFTDMYEELTEETKGQIKELRDIMERYPNEYDLGEFEGGIESLRR